MVGTTPPSPVAIASVASIPAATTAPPTTSRTPAPSPTPTATATPRPSPTPSLVVTLAQNGSTLHLAVGQRFLLDLGDSAVWAVTIADPHVLAQVRGVALPPGAQGVFAALARGSTTLSAIGSPPCASGICPLFRIAFQVTITVG